MVKFGRITVKGDPAHGFGLTTSTTYVRLHVHDKAELWNTVGRMMNALRARGADSDGAVTFEEVTYAEGMSYVLSDVLQWPLWEDAVKNGQLNLFDGLAN